MADVNEYDALNDRQILQMNEYKTIVEVYGKFDQSSSSDGAHYAPADANPFINDGLMCQNCVFFDGGLGCEIVAGDIQAEAVCKLWIIPDTKLQARHSVDGSDDRMYRQADNIEIRSQEDRVIEARAVPYDTPVNVGGYYEQIARGAFDGTNPADVKLYWRHGEPVGRVLELRSKNDGLYMTAKFSDTTAGRDAWTLARDGVEHAVSIGFRPIQDEWNADKTRVTRVKAQLVEVSTTDRPAYADAKILATREENPTQGDNMSDTAPAADATAKAAVDTRDARVDEIVERIGGLEAAITQVAEQRTAAPAAPVFRSFGEYIKARSAGDDKAEMLFRTIADNTLGDNSGVNPDNWLGNIYGLINRGRPVASAFGIGRLSDSGMTEHWPLVTQMPIVDAIDENDEVPSQQFIIEDRNAQVQMYAGGGNLSRLMVDRSSPSYVDAIGRSMAAAYGKRTEAAFVGALTGAATESTAFAGATLKDYVAGLANAAADIYEESEFIGDIVVVSRDVFVEWASLAASDGRPAFQIAGGTGANVAGTINIPGLGGNFAGLPVLMSLSAAPGTVLMASTSAAQFRESAGAPLSITKDEPSDLKRGIAVYGYGIPAVFQPAAVRSIGLD